MPWETLDWYIFNIWVCISLWVSLLHMVKYLLFLTTEREQFHYWKQSPVEKCLLAHLPFMAEHLGNSQRNRNVWDTQIILCSNYPVAAGFNFANLFTKAVTYMVLLISGEQFLAVFPDGNRAMPYNRGRGTGTRHPAQQKCWTSAREAVTYSY